MDDGADEHDEVPRRKLFHDDSEVAEPREPLPDGYNVEPAVLAKRAAIIISATALVTLVALLVGGSGLSGNTIAASVFLGGGLGVAVFFVIGGLAGWWKRGGGDFIEGGGGDE